MGKFDLEEDFPGNFVGVKLKKESVWEDWIAITVNLN